MSFKAGSYCIAFVLIALLGHAALIAADWPTFGRDIRRSQTTVERLDFAKVSKAWEWNSPQPPLPAWGQPAKGDAFANLRDFQSMRNYDAVFHPIIVGKRVFFGSNVDDTVRCLDAASGKTLWTFIAGGPVRIAPTFHEDKLYFGADDGFAYCVNAETGKLIWRMSPSADADERMVLNNGRLIPFWPCRSGVLVDGGTAYFTASLLPWKHSYLCAVDAATGKAEGEGRYVNELRGVTLEGALVASDELLFSPQGRESPLQFRRSDGKSQGTLGQGFGVFCVLTPQNRLLHGPKKKGGGIVDSDAKTRAPVATHKDARAMIVTGESSYLLTNDKLAAADLTARKLRWTIPHNDVAAMMLAGDALVLGQKDRVTAISAESGEEIWTAPVNGRVYGLAVAGGALYVSTDSGRLICFRQGQNVVQSGEEESAEVAVADSPKLKPRPIAAFEDEHLLDRWVFSPLAAKQGSDGTTFENFAKGLPARLGGKRQHAQDGGLDAVELDGATHSIHITQDLAKANLPSKEMTAEAWVRIDQPLEWGGIVGATQDNGSYERGWLLGYRKSKFSLSLAGKEGPGKLTYMNAAEDFEPGQWHHVVGTYDGAIMRLYVNGKLAASSTQQRGEINYPPRTFYDVGAYHDDNEHYRTRGLIHEVRVYRRALSAAEVLAHYKAKPIASGSSLELAVGPWAQFDSATSAVVHWHSDEPTISRVRLTDDAGRQRVIVGKGKTTNHALAIDQLQRDRRYRYAIETASGESTISTRPYELDTYFNYNLAALPKSARVETTKGKFELAAFHILNDRDRRGGFCLVVGSQTGEFAIEIARRSNVHVIGIETDVEMTAAARRRALELGVLGPRCSFAHVESLEKLPLPSHVADLVVSQTALEGTLSTPTVELHRVVRPGGELQLVRWQRSADSDEWEKMKAKVKAFAGDSLVEERTGENLDSISIGKSSPPGGADWTHMYGDAANAAYAGETLGGAKSVDDLEAAWLGKPGPRYQTDRQNRKSAPLFASGRLYMQGQQRVIALDGYNGLILWSLEIPDLMRFNIPRDASNWCCDKEHLFLAVAGRCWQIEGQTGKVTVMHAAPKTDKFKRFDWGYLARSDNVILGSAVRPDSSHTKFWGGEYWFDQKGGVHTHQICSDEVFALDKASGRRLWAYDEGMIWNASITVGDGRVYFITSKNKEAAAHQTGRVPTADLGEEQFLVALELKSGAVAWEQKIKAPAGMLMANMAYSGEKLVLSTSVNNHFPVTCYSATSGKQQWSAKVAWPRNHHGGHLSRPAIVGNKVFVRPATLDLESGKLLSNNMPGGGCGTYVASKNALFFRAGSGRQLSTWEHNTGQYKQWPRLRPDCWLSTIPAGGMLLSPEGGGGCSCGHWMEMSIGFQPVKREE